MADKLKLDYLLKTLVLCPFENDLVTLFASAIILRAEMQPIYTFGYRDEQSNLDIIANTLKLQAQQKDNVYRDEKSNLENPAKTSGLTARKNDNPNSKVRLPLKKMVLNLKTTTDSLLKKRGQPKKTTRLIEEYHIKFLLT